VFETVAAIIVAISLVLPGFIIADLAEARRAQPQARSDWELVLRALIYALVLQSAVLLTGWTTQLIDAAGLLRHAAAGMRPTWESHIGAIVLWVLVVILIAPTVLGLLLGWFLRRAERHGNLTWFHYALGGRDARDARDYIFLRYGSGFVLIHRKGASDPAGRYLVGKFGRASWAPQTPSSSRDIYFEEVWPAAADGQITDEFAVRRGVWLHSSDIEALFFIEPPDAPGPWHERTRARVRTFRANFPRRHQDATMGD
jgi:hypothetical protein